MHKSASSCPGGGTLFRLSPSALCLVALVGLFATTTTQADVEAPAPASRDRATAHYEFALGKLLADAGDFEGAVAAFERSTQLDPSDPYNFLEAAKFYGYLAQVSRTKQQQGSYLDQSLELLAQARELAKDNPDVLRLFAETHLRLGEQRPSSYAVAQGAFERLREIDPTDLRALTSLGQLYLFSREPGKAADTLAEAARHSPRNRMIYSMLVDALLSADRKPEAEDALVELVGLEPTNPDHRLKLAELRSERGDHAGAVEALEDPSEGDWLTGQRVRQALAREYHLAGRHEEALRVIDEVLEDPFTRGAPTGGVQRLKAAVLSSMLRYQDAIDVFEPLVEKSEDAKRRLQDALLLSRLYERIGSSAGAMEVLRRQLPSLEDRSLRAQLRLAIGGAAQRGGAFEAAAEEFRDVREMAGGSEALAAASQSLADVLNAQGRPEEAAAVLAEAIDKIAAKSEVTDQQLAAALRLRLATHYSESERWQPMLELGKLLAADQDPGIAFVGVQVQADALAGSGDLEAALGVLDTVPESSRQLTAKRIDLLYENGRQADAEEMIRELAETDLDNRFFAARLLQRYELHDRAAAELEKVAEQRGDNLQVLFALGAAYERSEHWQKAVATFEQLLKLSPDYAPALNYLAYMWAERGEHLDRALEMIRRAVATDPDNGAYVDSLGWAYYQLERFPEAKPHLVWAAGLTPDDPTVFEHLGDLYRALGEQDAARAAYLRALELSDEDQGIQGKLDDLAEPPGQAAPAPPPQKDSGFTDRP